MRSATVTQLQQHRQAAKRHPDGKRLMAIGQRFEDVVPPLLDGFFSASDDFLFKLAEKSSFESADYFEQLRVLRRRKVELRHHIIKDVGNWIDGGAQTLKEVESDHDDREEGTFSLMDDVVLERTLATDSFSSRLFEKAGDEWLAFHERMMALTCEKSLSNKNTPFNPTALGQIVLQQIETMGFPFKSSLMLFRLFDDMAIPKLIEFYRKSNGWLVEEGILPNLKLIQSRQSTQQDINAQTIAQISANLAGLTGQPMNSQPGFSGGSSNYGGGAGYAGTGGGTGVMIDPAILQQMLSSMAQFQTQSAPAAHSIDELKNWTSAQASAVTKQVEGTLEAGTVSLVAMLFEYILDDANLSAHMKQLLARMQIPIIKVAILDKEFFTDSDHSARLLLNRMARSATGWQPDAHIENDILLDGMESIVSQLNREFDDDLSIFDQLLEEFGQLAERYREQKNSHIETIKVVEEEAFEEHLKQDRARLFIDTLLEKQDLPEKLSQLLTGPWYRLMNGIFKKQGESKAWKTSARIARELVWTLQPSVQLTQAARFKELVPKLLDGVASGLKAAGCAANEIDSALEEIRNYHALFANPVNETIWEAQEKLEHFETQSQKADILVDEPAPLVIEEPVVPIKNADLSYYLDQVESMSTDQWFDIEQGEGQFVRGCLSLIIGNGSKYVFTDYQGIKIAERSAIGLAMGMRNDQFIPIAEDPLFDRMIDTLVDELGSNKSGSR